MLDEPELVDQITLPAVPFEGTVFEDPLYVHFFCFFPNSFPSYNFTFFFYSVVRGVVSAVTTHTTSEDNYVMKMTVKTAAEDVVCEFWRNSPHTPNAEKITVNDVSELI